MINGKERIVAVFWKCCCAVEWSPARRASSCHFRCPQGQAEQGLSLCKGLSQGQGCLFRIFIHQAVPVPLALLVEVMALCSWIPAKHMGKFLPDRLEREGRRAESF